MIMNNDFKLKLLIFYVLLVFVSCLAGFFQLKIHEYLICVILFSFLFFMGDKTMFNYLKINKLINKAKNSFKNDDLDNCLVYCNDILSVDSENIEALYYKAYIFYYKEKFEDSLNLLDILLEGFICIDALLLKGRILIYYKDYDNGLECYKKSLDDDIFDYHKYLDEVSYFGDSVLFKDNPKMFEISLSLCDFYLDKKDDDIVSYFKGHALYNLGFYDKSIDAFDFSLSLNPNFELAYSTKSEILLELERCDEALDTINKGLKLFPEGKLNFNKSRILYTLCKFDEALVFINKFLEFTQDSDAIEFKNKILDKLN